MSCIRFHGINEEVNVSGQERAHLMCLGADLLRMAIGAIWDTDNSPHWIRQCLPPGAYPLKSKGIEFERIMKTWLGPSCDDSCPLIVNGQEEPVFDIQLNTLVAVGLGVLAQINGQCEMHCYIEGKNRSWLAGEIKNLRDRNILRPFMGWEKVIQLLLSEDSTSIVLSYSVCIGFPDPIMDAGWENSLDDAKYDSMQNKWGALTKEERWALAMDGLRKKPGNLEITPEGVLFGAGISGFDLAAKYVERSGYE